jgi:hypothetical protein
MNINLTAMPSRVLTDFKFLIKNQQSSVFVNEMKTLK